VPALQGVAAASSPTEVRVVDRDRISMLERGLAAGAFPRPLRPRKPGKQIVLGGRVRVVVFNIGLALFELLVMRYGLKDLGIRFWGLAPVPGVVLCFGATAFISHSGVTWHEVVGEVNGRAWLVPIVSFLVAALPEEFLRMIWQTRLGAVLNSPATGWVAASVVWAFLHVPNFTADSGHCLQWLRIAFELVPLGLLWGYATHRSQSILPAVCLHGTNFWGLHNF